MVHEINVKTKHRWALTEFGLQEVLRTIYYCIFPKPCPTIKHEYELGIKT